MTIDTAALVDQRPHLKEPILLYAKWQEFSRRVADLLANQPAPRETDGSPAYPRGLAAAIVELFASCFALPQEALSALAEAVAKGDIDFMQLPTGDLLEAQQNGNDGEWEKLLFLFCRPYFLALGADFPYTDREWVEGRCPLCSARPALGSVVEGPKRLLHCSYCATSGPYRFIGCPHCGSVDTDQLGAILSEDEPGFRVVTCDACRSYLKVAESSHLGAMSLDHADLVSLPLDLVAQGKGYRRHAPNPIGLTKMA